MLRIEYNVQNRGAGSGIPIHQVMQSFSLKEIYWADYRCIFNGANLNIEEFEGVDNIFNYELFSNFNLKTVHNSI